MAVGVLTGDSYLRNTLATGRMIRFLVLAATTLLGLSSRLDRPLAYWSVSIIYGTSILIPILLGWARPLLSGSATMLLDVASIGTLIVLRGEEAQGLLVGTFTLMLLAAVLEGVGTIFLNAVIVSVGFVALTHWGGSASEILNLANTSQIALFFVTATLLGHVASQARTQASSRRNAERHRARAQVALHGVSLDLHENEERLRQAEETLRANDRLCTLGMLAAGVAHEIKNPLAAIAAGVEVIGEVVEEIRTDKAPIDGHALRDLTDAGSECREACEHLGHLALGLGNLSRVGVVRTDSVDLGTTLDIAARMLRRAAGPHIKLQVRGSAKRKARADPGRVLQVVLNLTKNAIDALGDQEDGAIILAHEDDGPDGVSLIVTDNGPGIPEALRARIFDPFVTTKKPGEGTGLGLHLVSEIVASHGGTITCEANKAGGALFRVRLPASEEPASAEGKEETAP